MTALERMCLHVEALYRHDARGRIVGSNEWRPAPAPRFHLGRTSEGPVRRFRDDLADELCAELSALGDCEAEIAAVLAAHTPIKRTWIGPAYALPPDLAIPPGARVATIGVANAGLLRGGFDTWLADVPHRQPFLAALEDGRAVAVCASVRITAAAHEAGVETLAAFRGRGHAVRVVAAWAEAVRRAGALALYSTSSDNSASQRVAAKLGAQQIGTDFHVT